MAQVKLETDSMKSANDDDDDLKLTAKMKKLKLSTTPEDNITQTTFAKEQTNQNEAKDLDLNDSSANNLNDGPAEMKNNEEKEISDVPNDVKPSITTNISSDPTIPSLPGSEASYQMQKFFEEQRQQQNQFQNKFLSMLQQLIQRNCIEPTNPKPLPNSTKPRPVNPNAQRLILDYSPHPPKPPTSISDRISNVYSNPMSEIRDNQPQSHVPFLITEDYEPPIQGKNILSHLKGMFNNQHEKGGEDKNEDEDDGDEKDENKNNDRENPNQNQNGPNRAAGSGRRRNDKNDRNGNNDRNNDDGNSSDVMSQQLDLLIQNQARITKVLEKKDKMSYTKLPKCNVKYYGKKKDGTNDDLVSKAWEVQLWCKTKGIDTLACQYNIWMSDVLQSPAKEQIYLQRNSVRNFDTLIMKLGEIYPIQSKLLTKLFDFRQFKYTKKSSMEQHLNRYKIMCNELNKELFVWKYISKQGRAPELPTLEQQWRILLNSIQNCADLHKETQKVVQMYNRSIFQPTYVLVEQDLKYLMKSMRDAAIVLYPSGEMQRYDITGTSRFPTSNKGRSRKRGSRNRDSDGRNNRNGRNTGRDSRNNKRDKMHYQNAKEFKGNCYACNGIHPVRLCKDKAKKKQYCHENKLCLFCCKPNHTISECKQRQEWEQKKKAGNKGNGNNKNNKNGQKWSRPALRHAVACKFKQNCRNKQGCYYLHESDRLLNNDENDDESNNSQNSQNENLKIERVNYVNVPKKSKKQKKQKVYAAKVRDTLEICRIDTHKLDIDQIPDCEEVALYFKTSEDNMMKHISLNDGGSTISAITPLVAEKVMKQAQGLKPMKSRKFYVENASGKDVIFEGKYLLIPTLIPNTIQFEEIKYYIMPNNQCAYGVILGLKDSFKLRYRTGLEVEDGKLLLKHRGDRRKRKLDNVERAQSIIKRIGNYPGHILDDSRIECYKNEKVIDEMKEDSSSDDDDSQGSSDDSSDEEDSEDGIRSH